MELKLKSSKVWDFEIPRAIGGTILIVFARILEDKQRKSFKVYCFISITYAPSHADMRATELSPAKTKLMDFKGEARF